MSKINNGLSLDRAKSVSLALRRGRVKINVDNNYNF